MDCIHSEGGFIAMISSVVAGLVKLSMALSCKLKITFFVHNIPIYHTYMYMYTHVHVTLHGT